MSRESDLGYVDKLLAFAERTADPVQRREALDEARRTMDRVQAERAAPVQPSSSSPAAMRRALVARLVSGRGGVERAGSGRSTPRGWSSWVSDPSGELRRVDG